MIQNLWGHKDVEWVAKGSVGLSGGLLIMWNADLFKVKFCFSGDNFLGLCVEWKEGTLYIINVYSSCSLAGKRKLWSDLLDFKLNNEQGDWCLGGDFNAVMKAGERKGSTSSFRQNERLEFCQFVEAMELIDVPVAGKKFSWFSGDGNAMSRLDRFLLSENFIDKEEVSGQWIGNRDISDHCPIWLLCSTFNWGPKPFKVNNCWLEHPGFKLFVEKIWEKLHISGKKAFVIKEKLKRLKEELRGWNREIFGILDLNIEKMVKELNEVEEIVGTDGENLVVGDKTGVNRKFWEQLHYKESLIKQKSRMKWIREGDSNTRFFHLSLKNRRRRNQLLVLKKGDDWIQGVDNIKMQAKNHFSRNFIEDCHNRPFVNGINFQKLSIEDNDLLLLPFSEEEVREVIWSCDGNKSPGPDGFNFNFLKACWSILKFDVMEFLNEFHQNAVLPKAITASFLALIPKKDHPQQLSDYRPICLIGMLYKILSKLLAARLKNVMGKLISTCQSAFIPGRQILDGVLVLNEVIDLAKRRKDCCLLFKVDFERAYDTISWNYLESMMLKMGFAERWMKWIRACIFNSSMSVLINGSPTEDFTVGKGLRQGDPLSPFLFLIAAEGLTGMVNKAVEIGKFVGYKVNDSIRFQILQFADDTILLGECSWDNVRTMKSILRGFELVSGLKVNFVKSKLYGINVEANVLEAAATFLDCSYDTIPFKFLGIPVGANPRRKATWTPIVDSMTKRLSRWNGRNLSIGGRVTLINSVLSSLPLYFFSFYKAPIGIINQLVRIQRNFLWGGSAEVKKLCWVSWAQVCLPKEKGGLGVKNIEMFNSALLCKWKWRCLNDKDAIWHALLMYRYGPLSIKLLSWDAVVTGSKDSLWWRDVVGIGGKYDDCWFPSKVSSVLGNGKSIGFWKEKWYGAVPLRDLFPSLFEKVLHKDSVVSELIQADSFELNWNRDWLSSLSHAELVEKAELEQLLFGLTVHLNIEDRWRWNSDTTGLFSVKSVYNFLQSRLESNIIEPNVLAALHKMWKNDIPSKVGVFGWRLLIEKLPTKAALASKVAIKLRKFGGKFSCGWVLTLHCKKGA
ncbi:cysteine-rich receptor-like protein kinase, partial [Trifolium pratense]